MPAISLAIEFLNPYGLPELPSAELRRLFVALQLRATYHHDRKQVDIEITLHERGLDIAQVCLVPPVGFEPTL